jgi:hypothetical protein
MALSLLRGRGPEAAVDEHSPLAPEGPSGAVYAYQSPAWPSVLMLVCNSTALLLVGASKTAPRLGPTASRDAVFKHPTSMPMQS